jgi:hypothetical protein
MKSAVGTLRSVGIVALARTPNLASAQTLPAAESGGQLVDPQEQKGTKETKSGTSRRRADAITCGQ